MSSKCRSFELKTAVYINYPPRISVKTPLKIKLFVPAKSISANDGIEIFDQIFVMDRGPSRATSQEVNGQLTLTYEYDQPVGLKTSCRNRSAYVANLLLRLVTKAVAEKMVG